LAQPRLFWPRLGSTLQREVDSSGQHDPRVIALLGVRPLVASMLA